MHSEPSIFARPFSSTAPPDVSRDVEHRREGHSESVSRTLTRSFPCRGLPCLRIKQSRLRNRYGKQSAMPMDDVEADQQRDFQPGVLYRKLLHLPNRPGPNEVEEVANGTALDCLGRVAGDDWTRDGISRSRHRELPQLLRQGHL